MFFRILLFLFRWIIYVTLPFILLIRGGVYLHIHFRVSAWTAVLGGMVMATLVLFIYLALLQRKVFRGTRSGPARRRMLLIFLVVAAYGLQSAFFLAESNAKTGAIQAEFRELHPLLRLSVSTVILLDRHILITDASRLPEDYPRMGLATKSQSLHYRQRDGYTHAFDLRTTGHPFWRNALLQGYFRMMGFHTLRHGGTGDHLHISLLSWDRPGAL